MPNVIPPNPYPVGNPVTGEAFFGREDVMQQAENVFQAKEVTSAAIIYGQRRIGKTSILLEMQRRLTSKGMVVVYVDLMDHAKKPFGVLLKLISQRIAKELKFSTDLAQIDFDDEGISFRRDFLPQVYRRLSSQRLLLLFDEFDVLNVFDREHLPENIAANRFFEALREWMREEPYLAFGFVLGREFGDTDTNFLATFKVGRTIPVSFLNYKSVQDLITKPETIQFDESAIKRIYDLTHGHPYFTQFLCHYAFENAYELSPNQVPIVNVTAIDRLIPFTIDAADNVFSWIWDSIPPVDCMILALLAEILIGAGNTISREDLLKTLQNSETTIPAPKLESALVRLEKWQILEKKNNGYRFIVPLIRYWVEKRKPLKDAQAELNITTDQADTFYSAGIQSDQEGRYDMAVDTLTQALAHNPDHLKARLSLGNVYIKQKDFDRAVINFEEAYKRYNDHKYEEVKDRLVESLLARASESPNEERNLSDYDRVLQISPNNTQADERRSTIFHNRAERDLSKERYADAISAYREAHNITLAETISKSVEFFEKGRGKFLRKDFLRARDDFLSVTRLTKDTQGLEVLTARADLMLAQANVYRLERDLIRAQRTLSTVRRKALTLVPEVIAESKNLSRSIWIGIFTIVIIYSIVALLLGIGVTSFTYKFFFSYIDNQLTSQFIILMMLLLSISSSLLGHEISFSLNKGSRYWPEAFLNALKNSAIAIVLNFLGGAILLSVALWGLSMGLNFRADIICIVWVAILIVIDAYLLANNHFSRNK